MPKANIAERMRVLIETSRRFPAYRIPLTPELEESWSEDYAIVGGYYFEPRGFEPEGEYVEIDYERRDRDFRDLILDAFGGGIIITNRDPQEGLSCPIPDGMLIVRLRESSQEIEAYRHKVSRSASNPDRCSGEPPPAGLVTDFAKQSLLVRCVRWLRYMPAAYLLAFALTVAWLAEGCQPDGDLRGFAVVRLIWRCTTSMAWAFMGRTHNLRDLIRQLEER